MMYQNEKPYAFKPFFVEKVSSTTLPDDNPKPRSGHRIVCDGSNLYCFGGYNPALEISEEVHENPPWAISRPLFRELWSFCFARRSWRLHNVQDTIPQELASAALCLTGSTLIVYGGTGSPFGHRCSNSVNTYNVTGRNGGLHLFTTRGQHPLPQYGQAIFFHDGYLYTIGGTNGFLYTCDIHRLDMRSMTWELVYVCCGNRLDEPAGRYRHEIAFDGVNIYILGGGTAEWSFDFSDIPVFNLETSNWSFKASKPDPKYPQAGIPVPRKCHSAVQINNSHNIHVFIIGGSDGDSMFDDIWRLEIPTFQWTLMKKSILPKALHFHSSAITPAGCSYTFGGIELNDDEYDRTNKLFKTWLCIPKLSEIGWESVLHYFPQLAHMERSKLLLLGIPLDFVDRLIP